MNESPTPAASEATEGTLWYAPILNGYGPESDEREQVTDPSAANLVSSRRADGLHNIQLDLDGPHTYSPSSKKGHGHLTIPVGITWEKYEQLLRLLAECGVIEQGYLKHALSRQATFLRPPHIKKVFKDLRLDAYRGLMEISAMMGGAA